MFDFVHFRRFRDKASLILFTCLAFPTLAFAQTSINFDDVADGTDIRSHYQGRGVVFSCEGSACADPVIANGIYARATANTASAPNSVSPLKTRIPGVADQLTGRVIASFASPVKSVSIDAKTVQVPEPLNQTHFANMLAFDASGALVATAVATQFNQFEILTVTAADNQIVKVSLGVTGPTSVAVFDNLQFSGDPGFRLIAFIIVFLIVFIYILFSFIKKKKDLPRPPTSV